MTSDDVDCTDGREAGDGGGGHRAARLVDRGESIVFERGPLSLRFDGGNGALRRVEDGITGLSFAVSRPEAPPLEWTVGGNERRTPPQAVSYYEGAETFGADLELVEASLLSSGRESRVRTVATTPDWRLDCEYAIAGEAPRVTLSFDLTYQGEREEVRLRRARIPIEVGRGGALGDDWTVDLPGAPVPPSMTLGDLDDGTVLEWGPRRIHTGLVGLDRPDSDGGLATWAFSRDWSFELETALRTADRGRVLSNRYELWTAARLAAGEGVSFDGLRLAPYRSDWSEWLGSFRDWWDEVGLETPSDTPDWLRGGAIFEAHVGAAKFRDGFVYEPYPTMDDLVTDLRRIADLGFDAVQLMPQHPYPSYIVVDEADETAWGDPEALHRLVDEAHDVGLEVILDVVMHGVLDRDVLERTRDSIATNDLLGGDPDKVAQYVVDHADAWENHLPERAPLRRDHPDWFVRDDDGDIAHRYTHALDLAIPAVQSYFVDRLRSLVTEFDVDGFRLDAPTWNQFPNWADELGHPAGHAPLGAVALFRQAREALGREDPRVCLYVEAAGPLFRESSDVNYNYDEMWLLDAVFGGDATRFGHSVPDISASDMATWLARRDAALPTGSRTVHHVDSHDKFWWPDPGEKWLRERYGSDAADAAIAAFGLIDGAFMSYVGAERGHEDFIRRVLALRSALPELADGACEYLPDVVDHPGVFSAHHSHDGNHSLLAVNVTDEPVTTAVDPPVGAVRESGPVVTDRLGDDRVENEVAPGEAFSVSFDPYQPRLLVFRREG